MVAICVPRAVGLAWDMSDAIPTNLSLFHRRSLRWDGPCLSERSVLLFLLVVRTRFILFFCIRWVFCFVLGGGGGMENVEDENGFEKCEMCGISLL